MATYTRTTRVDAPLEVVWRFHSTAAGLVEVTPDWLGLEVEAVDVGPQATDAGGPDVPSATAERPDLTAVLETGSTVDVALRPLGVGPRVRWQSVIERRHRDEHTASFRDRMVDGPFDTWIHTHQFAADGDETVVRDVVEFELDDRLPGAANHLAAAVGLPPAFWYRHRRTRRVLSGRPAWLEEA